MKLLIIVSLLILAACNPSPSHSSLDSDGTPTTQASGTSIDAFAATLYSFGQSHGCMTCHSSRVNPRWLDSNVTTAYGFARPLVDFTNPTASVFANYAGNNHCNSPSCNTPANVAVMQSLLSQWAEIEIQQGSSTIPLPSGTTLSNPAFVTQAMAIPSPLPLVTAGTPAVMRFDLSQLSPAVPALNGAILELSIQAYNELANEYKVFNPRIIGAKVPVTISGMHVYVRSTTLTGLGSEDVNQGVQWSGLSVIAPVVALPAPLPAGPISSALPLTTTSLAVIATAPDDVITIGFAGIQ